MSMGFGRHLYDVDPPSNIPAIGRLGQVQLTLSILSAVWSKTSFAVTLLRLVQTRPAFKAVVWFVIVTINLFMILGIVSRASTRPLFAHNWPVDGEDSWRSH